MSETTPSHVIAKTQRLNSIIDVLLSRVASLESENARLKTILGISAADNSNTLFVDGINSTTSSNNNFNKGIREETNSNNSCNTGISGSASSLDNSNIGISRTANGNESSNVGISTSAKPLPQTLEISQGLISLLSQVLRQSGFKHATRDTTENAARLLLHFHNKGRGGYPELRKLTGLSEGGVAKFIMSLKKRNLIKRTGYQQFAPTPHADQIMQKCLI